MERRHVLAALGGALLFGATPGTNAQTARTARRIGILTPGEAGSRAETERIWAPARELGWIAGQNLILEIRASGDNDELLARYAEELVRLNVEIIVTNGTAAAIAARNATTRIPIVMYSAGDPVRAGLVTSLRRPGGNITGFSVVGSELDAKDLDLVRELVPNVQRVAVLVHSGNPYYERTREDLKQTYRSVGVEPLVLEIAAQAELENAVAEASRQRAQALIVPPDVLFGSNRALIMRSALAHRLPTIVRGREYLEAGGLLSLDILQAESDRSLAYFVDKILRGAKPADLPIQRPTRFVMLINLKTAKALGIKVPPSLLQRADEVIE